MTSPTGPARLKKKIAHWLRDHQLAFHTTWAQLLAPRRRAVGGLSKVNRIECLAKQTNKTSASKVRKFDSWAFSDTTISIENHLQGDSREMEMRRVDINLMLVPLIEGVDEMTGVWDPSVYTPKLTTFCLLIEYAWRHTG